MIQISRFKIYAILAVCLYGFAFAAPNFVPALQSYSGWIPHKTVNLGLDLRGGAHLLYEVDMDGVFDDRKAGVLQDLTTLLKDAEIVYSDLKVIENGVSFSLPPLKAQVDGSEVSLEARQDHADVLNKISRLVRQIDSRLYLEQDGHVLSITMIDSYMDEIRDQTISQVIEVVRRRIDELGTTEPMIARQGENRVIIQAPGADSDELRKLIGKTAKLGFHLTGDQTKRKVSEMALPFEETPGRKLNVKRAPIITGEMLENATPTFDQTGQAVVSFRLDSVGARKFCGVTRKYTGQPFAIVLDNTVISAPRINEPICGGQGQISGGFTIEEASELALLLRAGALPADIEVVEERSVGPSLGADSVEAGKIASLIGLSLVLVFMFLSYGLFGLMANVALVVNIALILALLSSLQATLTLPGIAGIVLTVGMAVDANVLIFERIREEVAQGRSAISAIDAGYSRAMATIIDSNLTTLIAAVILFSFGTGPIKGFSVTLGIGIVTSFFSAIMVTRLLVVLWLANNKPKTLPI